MIDLAWPSGARHPAHPVSDGNVAIASGIGRSMAGMRRTGGVFHLLREYRWNIEATGFTVAYRTPSRLERHSRGRRRERMGTVGTNRNLRHCCKSMDNSARPQ